MSSQPSEEAMIKLLEFLLETSVPRLVESEKEVKCS